MRRAWQTPNGAPLLLPGQTPPDLPYTIELVDTVLGDQPRIIARAADLPLAQAMYRAALAEYPAGSVLLKHGEAVLHRSGH
jgi:hypothetical protein